MNKTENDFFTEEEVTSKSLEYFNGDDLATSTFINKYALKMLDGNRFKFYELTPDDMHDRLAREFSRIENNYSNPRKYEDFRNALDHFKYIVPGGSVMYGVANPYVNVSLSNCIALSAPGDSISEIFDKSKDMANLFKARCGIGLPLDTLRPDGSRVNNSAGSSTGAWSFANFYSEVCRMIGQSGRRGALMLTMNVKHPDIEKFVTMKRDLTKVTGANVSVMITDEFMNAVKNDETWTLQWPTDVPINEAKYIKEISAKDLWYLINESATYSGEPGLIFIDNYKKNLPADYYPGFESVCVNPCCFSQEKEVLVITDNGIKEIKDITNQDKVWLNGEYIKTSGYFNAGENMIYEVKFNHPNSTIYITKNHKLLKVNDNDKEKLFELKDIFVGDNIRFIKMSENNKFEKIKYKITEINPIGIQKTGCIEVPDYHMFTLKNGMVSGNSEILLSEYDSCRLTSINLKSFVINPFTDKAYFDFDKFEEIVKLSMRMLDNIIDLEIECLDKMINKVNDISEKNLWTKLKKTAENGRRTGLGTHGFADALACLCIKYDTKEAQDQAEKIYSSLRNFAYEESVKLAIERGKFSCFDWEIDKKCDFIQRLPENLQNDIKKYGRRNISLLTNAPTGSVSIVSQTSSGIEPVFMNSYIRRKKVSSDIDRVDFTDDSGDKWTEYIVLHHNIIQYLESKGIIENQIEKFSQNNNNSEIYQKILEELPEYFITAMEIDALERVKIQGVIQANIDHGISSCLTGDTLIQTDKGLLKIKEIAKDTKYKQFKNVNIAMKSMNEHNTLAEIKQSYNNGYETVLNIITEKGFNIKCTKNHSLLVLNDKYQKVWKYARDIQKGDMIISRIGLNMFPDKKAVLNNDFIIHNNTFPTNITPDLSRLLGYIYSQDFIDQNGISITQVSEDICNDFVLLMKNLFGISCDIQIENADKDLYSVKVNLEQSEKLFSWLVVNDMYDIEVPSIIRSSYKKIVKEFIKGTSIKNYITDKGIAICNSSFYNYIQQIQMLLLNIGIDAEIMQICNEGDIAFSDNDGKHYVDSKKWMIFLPIKEARKFIMEIGFVEDQKINEYIKKTKNSKVNKKSIPDYELRLNFRQTILPFIKSKMLYNFFDSMTCKNKQNLPLSKENIKQMLDMGLNVPEFLLDDTYTYRKVKDIELIENPKMTFDISVPEGHSYIANGVISHNTINLPKETSVEQVQKIYETSWENQLKGVTVYVENSRSGVLISKKEDDKIRDAFAPVRPKELPCDIHHSNIDGQKWTIFVGMLDGRPYEIFGGLAEYVTIPKKYKSGKIIKTKNGKKNVNGRFAFYNLVIDDDDNDPLEVQNIAVTFNNGNYAAQTRIISLALRNGIPAQYIAEQLSRDENSEIFSFNKVMARVLKKYVADGTEGSDLCELCGAKLRFEGGCQYCPNCGSSMKCD